MLSSLIVGAGCFWGVEVLYEQMPGVINATSGYSGGHLDNPRYEDVLTGETGHVEVVKIDYDSSEVTFNELIDTFFIIHDPTTLNRQGNDVGSQYRSSIFTSDPVEKKLIQERIAYYNENKFLNRKIVTKIEPENIFYEAEDYHHNYFQLNKQAPYCRMVISPKVQKLIKNHSDLLG